MGQKAPDRHVGSKDDGVALDKKGEFAAKFAYDLLRHRKTEALPRRFGHCRAYDLKANRLVFAGNGQGDLALLR